MPVKTFCTIDRLIKKLERIKDAYGNIPVMVGGNFFSLRQVVDVSVNSADPNELAMAIINVDS